MATDKPAPEGLSRSRTRKPHPLVGHPLCPSWSFRSLKQGQVGLKGAEAQRRGQRWASPERGAGRTFRTILGTRSWGDNHIRAASGEGQRQMHGAPVCSAQHPGPAVHKHRGGLQGPWHCITALRTH